jgi:hypothetical protein
MASSKISTPISGIVQQIGDNSAFTIPVVGIDNAYKIAFLSATSNSTAGGGFAANQALCGIQLASGTTDGQVIAVTNVRAQLQSFIFLQCAGASGKKLIFDTVVTASGSFTFTVRTVDGAATTAACDVWYLVFN